MYRLLFGASVALSLPVTPLTAKPLEPAGKWHVDFGDNRCVAFRTYGPASDPIHLLIKPSPVGDVLQLSIAEKGHESYGVQEKATLTLDDGAPISLFQLKYGVEKKAIRLINLSKENAAKLAASDSMTWTSLHRDYQLPLGPMASLIKIVEKCRSTLADHWNGTPEKQAAQQKPVTFDRPIVSLFSSDDYPADALRRDLGGTAMIVALVDDKGKMADCAVVETSGVAVLDAQTCIMIRKRGKFTPAIGADGKPARAVFTQRVRWEIP